MCKVLIFSFLFIWSNIIFSQEESTPEESMPVVEESKVEPIRDLDYVDLVKIYFKTNKHENAEEILWSLSDSNYDSIKNNEFEYVKTKEAKYKEMKERISLSEDKKLPLNLEVELGAYNFKNEEFPIKDIVSPGRMGLDLSLLKSEISFNSGKMSLDKYELASSAFIKFGKLDRLKNIKMKKELAEKIVANLTSNRRMSCILNFDHFKIKNKVFKIAKYKTYSLKGSADFVDGKCFMDELRTQEAFSF